MEPDSITTDREFRDGLVELMSRRTTVRAIAAETGLSKTSVSELRHRNRTPQLPLALRLVAGWVRDVGVEVRSGMTDGLVTGAYFDHGVGIPDLETLPGTARLDMLDGADARTSMRAVLSWSYRHLAPATARTSGPRRCNCCAST